jgi:hypothetical protein
VALGPEVVLPGGDALVEEGGVLAGEDDGGGGEAVLECIETDAGLALG